MVPASEFLGADDDMEGDDDMIFDPSQLDEEQLKALQEMSSDEEQDDDVASE